MYKIMSYIETNQGRSDRAEDAETRGFLPLSRAKKVAAKKLGVTVDEAAGILRHMGPSEWHHTGLYGKRTDYYDTNAGALKKEITKMNVQRSFSTQISNMLSCAYHFRGQAFVRFVSDNSEEKNTEPYCEPNKYLGRDRYWGLQPEFGFKVYPTLSDAEARVNELKLKFPQATYEAVDAESDILDNKPYLPEYPDLHGKTLREIEAQLPSLYGVPA